MADPVSGTTSDLGDAAKRIPPAGWVGIVGAGLLIGLYLRRRTKAAPVTVGDAAAASTNLPSVPHGGTVLTPYSSTPAALGTAPRATSNRDWLRLALNFLIAKGVDAGTADTALHAYLNGDPMDVAGSAAIRLALAEFGPPPDGIPPPHFTAPPPNPIPSSPPPLRTPGDPSTFINRFDGGLPFTPEEQALRAKYHRENVPRGTSIWITPEGRFYRDPGTGALVPVPPAPAPPSVDSSAASAQHN